MSVLRGLARFPVWRGAARPAWPFCGHDAV